MFGQCQCGGPAIRWVIGLSGYGNVKANALAYANDFDINSIPFCNCNALSGVCSFIQFQNQVPRGAVYPANGVLFCPATGQLTDPLAFTIDSGYWIQGNATACTFNWPYFTLNENRVNPVALANGYLKYAQIPPIPNAQPNGWTLTGPPGAVVTSLILPDINGTSGAGAGGYAWATGFQQLVNPEALNYYGSVATSRLQCFGPTGLTYGSSSIAIPSSGFAGNQMQGAYIANRFQISMVPGFYGTVVANVNSGGFATYSNATANFTPTPIILDFPATDGIGHNFFLDPVDFAAWRAANGV